jgi:hypothetical protein
MSRCTVEAELVVQGERRHLRCLKRPHEGGLHVGIAPEGTSSGVLVWWNPGGRAATPAEIHAELTPLAAPAPAAPVAPAPVVISTPAPVSKTAQYTVSRQKGYTGASCPSCGSLDVVQSGTCGKCLNCGSTTGCS